MSIEVKLSRLRDAVAERRFAYLLTVTDEQRVHAVMATPSVTDDGLVLDGLGRRTRANMDARAGVTLVWPPAEDGGYSLIVDGEATLTDEGARIAPGRAVLHRPANADSTERAAGSATGCGSDCVPIS